MSSFTIKNSILCEELLKLNSSDRNISCLESFIKLNYVLTEDEFSIVKKKLENLFYPTFKRKFANVFYKVDVFRQKFSAWLSGEFRVSFEETPKRGRPTSGDFESSSISTKRKKIISITDSLSPEEIKNAFYKNLRDSGRKHLIKQIDNILGGSEVPETDEVIPFTAEECIALMEDLKLSQWQYEIMKMKIHEKNANLFMPYKKVSTAKEMCYPSQGLSITEKGAKVNIQDLLDHTATRILKMPEVLSSLEKNNETELVLHLTSKWGCDGSSDHSRYKQIFSDGTTSDESIFMASLVPLVLETDSDENKIAIWRNPQPGSTRYCRPLSFQYEKETPENTLLLVSEIKEAIGKLSPSDVPSEVGIIKIHHVLMMTMVDGKVCTVLTGTSSPATCCICNAKPSEMNNLQKVMEKGKKEDNFQYGVSSLHAKIRFMENVLNIAYRLRFCKWQAKTTDEKALMQEEKKRIQKEFKEKTGLLVDLPMHGSGNTNDGNTARRFFQNPEVTAAITGVDERLIRSFGIILQVLACGSQIDPHKFGDYAMNTARRYIELYKWYNMPASVHKILVHGAEIIQSFLVPIGTLTEEAQESRNKDLKYFRQFHTRKTSRVHTNTDLIHKLLVSSDPFISSIRQKTKQSKLELDDEAKELLL